MAVVLGSGPLLTSLLLVLLPSVFPGAAAVLSSGSAPEQYDFTSPAFYLERFLLAGALLFGTVFAGLAVAVTVPRLLGRLIEPGERGLLQHLVQGLRHLGRCSQLPRQRHHLPRSGPDRRQLPLGHEGDDPRRRTGSGGVGLLGSPPFEIPRSVQRDVSFDRYRTGEEFTARLARKNRSNLATIAAFLLQQWLGVRVGKKLFDDGALMPEKTMVTIGDHCTLGAESTIQCHSLEDASFKSDHIVIGDGVTIGANTYVHYGVWMGERSVLDADAFLMKGEQPAPDERWRGNPARAVPEQADPAISVIPAPRPSRLHRLTRRNPAALGHRRW